MALKNQKFLTKVKYVLKMNGVKKPRGIYQTVIMVIGT